jgi:hypothetical protein
MKILELLELYFFFGGGGGGVVAGWRVIKADARNFIKIIYFFHSLETENKYFLN